jgi:hypothetical protein
VLQVATQLPGHDDREQFLAGIDLILAGITTIRQANRYDNGAAQTRP